jgi:hypothetical protein
VGDVHITLQSRLPMGCVGAKPLMLNGTCSFGNIGMVSATGVESASDGAESKQTKTQIVI